MNNSKPNKARECTCCPRIQDLQKGTTSPTQHIQLRKVCGNEPPVCGNEPPTHTKMRCVRKPN